MSQELEQLRSWDRKDYEENGGSPFVFYVVYGAFTDAPKISRNKYRCDGIPEGVELDAYDDEVRPEVRDGFMEGFLWEELQKANPELAEIIKKAPRCVVITGQPKEDTTLNYLRDIVGMITCFLDEGCVGIFDPQMFKWWSPDEWRSRIFEPDGPAPRNHVVILSSEEEKAPGGTWLHTRGMRKFGRPDLSVHHVQVEHRDAIVDLINRYIDYQAFGGVIADDEEIKVEALPEGMRCHHAGHLDDPEFNNTHVEIAWPESK